MKFTGGKGFGLHYKVSHGPPLIEPCNKLYVYSAPFYCFFFYTVFLGKTMVSCVSVVSLSYFWFCFIEGLVLRKNDNGEVHICSYFFFCFGQSFLKRTEWVPMKVRCMSVVTCVVSLSEGLTVTF